MSTSQQFHVVDLEASNSNGGRSGGGGGSGVGGAEVDVVGGGGPPSSNATEIVENNGNKLDKDERRKSNASECSVEIVDLESGQHETKVHSNRTVKDCRICHLSMDATNQDPGIPIELGCSCKDDLASAHKQCAEAWFKIKGNITCEICGSIAQNVAGTNEAEMEQRNESSDAAAGAMAHPPSSESRNFWQGHRFLNFLLASMVFAFVISWLFHFNVPT